MLRPSLPLTVRERKIERACARARERETEIWSATRCVHVSEKCIMSVMQWFIMRTSEVLALIDVLVLCHALLDGISCRRKVMSTIKIPLLLSGAQPMIGNMAWIISH